MVTGDTGLYTALLNAWCPEQGQVKVYLTDTGEEAILLQEWLRLRMIRSQVSRVVDAGEWFCSNWTLTPRHTTTFGLLIFLVHQSSAYFF